MAPITLCLGLLQQPIEQKILPRKKVKPRIAEARGWQKLPMKIHTSMGVICSRKLYCTLCHRLKEYHSSQLRSMEYLPLPVSGYPNAGGLPPTSFSWISSKRRMYSGLQICLRLNTCAMLNKAERQINVYCEECNLRDNFVLEDNEQHGEVGETLVTNGCIDICRHL